MSNIYTTPSGVHVPVDLPSRLATHSTRQFITDISKQSLSRIVEALAKDSIGWKESAKMSPSLTELSAEVVAKNETAASEIGILDSYLYAIHCMTN